MAAGQRSTDQFGQKHAKSSGRETRGSPGESAIEDAGRERPAGPKCVLIVEDHPLNMKLFRALLESQSYRTLAATEGQVGLALARERNPDLVIMDVELPDVSGTEIIRALKADDRTRHIPIVAITASMPDAETRIRAAGSDGFMTKPIATAEFLSIMRSYLDDDSAT